MTRRPNEIDKYIGRRLCDIRTAERLSADAVVTSMNNPFSYQNYLRMEAGTVRIPIGVLYDICQSLRCDILDVLPESGRVAKNIQTLVNPAERRLVRDYNEIGNKKVQKAVCALVRRMAENMRPDYIEQEAEANKNVLQNKFN